MILVHDLGSLKDPWPRILEESGRGLCRILPQSWFTTLDPRRFLDPGSFQNPERILCRMLSLQDSCRILQGFSLYTWGWGWRICILLTLSLQRVISHVGNCPKFPLQPHQPHSMENLAFHILLGWKLIVLPTLTHHWIHFSLKLVGRMYFLNLEWKGYEPQQRILFKMVERVAAFTWNNPNVKSLETHWIRLFSAAHTDWEYFAVKLHKPREMIAMDDSFYKLEASFWICPVGWRSYMMPLHNIFELWKTRSTFFFQMVCNIVPPRKPL